MPKRRGQEILALAATFEGDFSLRWLAELAGTRSSDALSSLGQAVQKGWVSDWGPTHSALWT